MLMPRKVAHRKHHRGRTKGLTKGGSGLNFGEYGIQALEPGWITARQIDDRQSAVAHRQAVAFKKSLTVGPAVMKSVGHPPEQDGVRKTGKSEYSAHDVGGMADSTLFGRGPDPVKSGFSAGLHCFQHFVSSIRAHPHGFVHVGIAKTALAACGLNILE